MVNESIQSKYPQDNTRKYVKVTFKKYKKHTFNQQSAGGEGKKKKFDRLFNRFAGDDNVVDARELKKILNKGFKQGTYFLL